MRIFAVFGFLIISFHLSAQSGPIMGYDKVVWGASVADVRRAYSIGGTIVTTPVPNDPNIIAIQQDNVSDSIETRVFMFIENKLYQVMVEYRDPSANTARSLLASLASNFGDRTEHNVEFSPYDNDRREDITVFGRYSPELVVEVFHTYISNEETYLEVCYTWKKFYSEYHASRIN